VNILLLALGISLAFPGGGPGPVGDHPAGPESFQADLVLRPAEGPETHIFLRPGQHTVALRLSIPLGESEEEAGAGQILRSLADSRMRGMARRIGARALVSRTPEALVYEVSGPASELDFLVRILNEGLRPPEPDRFNQVRRDQLAEVLRRQETPQGVLALRIREAAGGSRVPLLGSTLALERMHAGTIQGIWERSHAQDRARLVLVGDVVAEVALASLVDLRLPASSPSPVTPPGGTLAQPRLSPEVIRHWVAEAWTLDRPRDARALVMVGLLGDRLRERGGDYELGAEVWEIAGRWTLVVSGAAYPRTQQAMRSRLQGLLAEVGGAVSDESVRTHAARVRGDILLQAATPWGLADLVGQSLDAGLEPRSVQMVLDDLTRMEASDIRSLLSDLASRSALRQEIRP
jgi:predicted Zn-dependent peptidase